MWRMRGAWCVTREVYVLHDSRISDTQHRIVTAAAWSALSRCVNMLFRISLVLRLTDSSIKSLVRKYAALRNFYVVRTYRAA